MVERQLRDCNKSSSGWPRQTKNGSPVNRTFSLSLLFFIQSAIKMPHGQELAPLRINAALCDALVKQQKLFYKVFSLAVLFSSYNLLITPMRRSFVSKSTHVLCVWRSCVATDMMCFVCGAANIYIHIIAAIVRCDRTRPMRRMNTLQCAMQNEGFLIIGGWPRHTKQCHTVAIKTI